MRLSLLAVNDLFADGGVYSFRDMPDDGEMEYEERNWLMHNPVSQHHKFVALLRPTDYKLTSLQQVTTQLEPLLWLAHKMQLAPLISSLQDFIHSSVVMEDGLLRKGCLSQVFTPRVLEAALGPGCTTGAREWMDSIVAQPVTVSGKTGQWSTPLLEPCSGQPARPYSFRARLTRKYLGMAAGTEVEVKVSLEEGRMRIGRIDVPVQLLVGPDAGRCLKPYAEFLLNHQHNQQA
jgi:hypothetical protein